MTQTHQTQMIERFNSRQAVIGIVGLGYVGLPLMLRYTGVGFRVLGIDIDPAKVETLNEHGKALKGSQVLVLGAAYKKNVDDDRESPSYKLMDLLMEKGAAVSYSDPHIPSLRPGRKYDFGLTSTPLTAQTLAEADCVLIATAGKVFPA